MRDLSRPFASTENVPRDGRRAGLRRRHAQRDDDLRPGVLDALGAAQQRRGILGATDRTGRKSKKKKKEDSA